MRMIPLGLLLVLSLAGCSSSANSLTGPDDIKPSMDPGDLGPRAQVYSVVRGPHR
jgi:hypothetical protein